MAWAIKNTRTGKWVYGTNFRTTPHQQHTSENRALMFEEEMDAISEMRHRQCSKDYKVVEVELREVE